MPEEEDRIAVAVNRIGIERSLLDVKVTDTLLTGLNAEGAQHKQWALWHIAEILGLTHFLSDVEDRGIKP